ncbi:WhiB family transcriptional regulator [Streptomyces fulvissimus]|uniref:Transcriptional regulator WhiB n=2 Tax=Streptomyces microflavus TaxID=1919 RepID=A0A6N9VBY9_STRMI|nr:WhiB family transcriptional regulator [Streptomyces microflavus]NEE49886.1 WhiB family transcriptional regulator [Streptomyces sp. SID8455]
MRAGQVRAPCARRRPADAAAVQGDLRGGGMSTDLAWRESALCAQTDPEAHFPEAGNSSRNAKKTCGACEVRPECLAYALSSGQRYGVWGGLGQQELRRAARRTAA